MSLTRTWSRLLVGALLLIAAALVINACGDKARPAPSTSKAPETAQAVPGAAAAAAEFAGLQQHGEYVGNPKAPYTLVEFGDLQCPACKFYADTTLPAVVAKFVRSGQVRLAFRAFEFVGPDSAPAAAYAWAAAKQNRLHQFAKLWYLNQGDENSGYVTDAFAGRIAGGVAGIKVPQLIQDAKSVAVRLRVQRTSDEFKANGFSGTPSFLFGKTGSRLESIELGDGSPQAAVAAISGAITPS